MKFLKHDTIEIIDKSRLKIDYSVDTSDFNDQKSSINSIAAVYWQVSDLLNPLVRKLCSTIKRNKYTKADKKKACDDVVDSALNDVAVILRKCPYDNITKIIKKSSGAIIKLANDINEEHNNDEMNLSKKLEVVMAEMDKTVEDAFNEKLLGNKEFLDFLKKNNSVVVSVGNNFELNAEVDTRGKGGDFYDDNVTKISDTLKEISLKLIAKEFDGFDSPLEATEVVRKHFGDLDLINDLRVGLFFQVYDIATTKWENHFSGITNTQAMILGRQKRYIDLDLALNTNALGIKKKIISKQKELLREIDTFSKMNKVDDNVIRDTLSSFQDYTVAEFLRMKSEGFARKAVSSCNDGATSSSESLPKYLHASIIVKKFKEFKKVVANEKMKVVNKMSGEYVRPYSVLLSEMDKEKSRPYDKAWHYDITQVRLIGIESPLSGVNKMFSTLNEVGSEAFNVLKEIPMKTKSFFVDIDVEVKHYSAYARFKNMSGLKNAMLTNSD
jgi:hypothetical protein